MAYTKDGREIKFSDIGAALSSALGNKENDPRYKLNPKWTSDRKRNVNVGKKWILKTDEELLADEKVKNATVTSQPISQPISQPTIDQNNLPDGVPKLFEAGQITDSSKLGDARLGPLDLGGKSVDDYLTNDKLQMMNSNVSNMLGQGGTTLNYNALNNAMGKDVNPNAASINKYVNQNAYASPPVAPPKTPFEDNRTKFGNFMATIGGDDYKTADELNNMSVKDRDAYLKNRDKQKWGGIAEAIAIGDDQFNRRDVNEGVALREKSEAARLKAERERQEKMSNNNFALTALQNDNRFSVEEKKAIAGSPDRLEEYGKNAIDGNVTKRKLNELALKGVASLPQGIQSKVDQIKLQNPNATDSQIFEALDKKIGFDLEAHFKKNLTPEEITYINTFGGSGESLAEKISKQININ